MHQAIRKQKRKWTKEQLLKSLEILGTLPAPLPPTLPPSPPASRSSSPAPSNKRKADQPSEQDSSKRQRTNNAPEPHPPHHHSHRPHAQPFPQQRQYHPIPSSSSYRHPSPAAFNPRNEPAEDGEVPEDPVVPSSARPALPHQPISSTVPIRRPKVGRQRYTHFDALHDKYHNAGRMLKYSGDARFWSTYPVTHKEYRPLPVPLSPNSPYHKHGGLIARLELLDALVCFTYSIWNKDYSRQCCQKDYWTTIEAFLVWCKQKWVNEDGINDAEKAFLGLIWMIEAFIHGRKVYYSAKHQDVEVGEAVLRAKAAIETAIKDAEANPSGTSSGSLGSSSTPPMLPSPASIAPASSTNSTPTTRSGDTPLAGSGSREAASSSKPAPAPNAPLPVPSIMLPADTAKEFKDKPLPPHISSALEAVTIEWKPTLIHELKETTASIKAAAFCMDQSAKSLTLPVVARFFPVTFARMMYSTLSANEEHEPDIEDEEGELFWPGQLITGEGLGWVCLMGKAMIKEFGKAYGYKGLDGVVPKPTTSKHPGPSGGSRQQHRDGHSSQRSGSASQGRSTPVSGQR
ncbi:hypothetical protein HGRIS_002612 [Hohenbuehelia grisea]|uniref:Uncharacterized protein n=1 Tax=Hohenbuehelia grisea TaxID=104357 RepID=A0ABR3JLP1_9AGAR